MQRQEVLDIAFLLSITVGQEIQNSVNLGKHFSAETYKLLVRFLVGHGEAMAHY